MNINTNSNNALSYLQKGNVFLTGPPGSGKSYVILQYIEYCNMNGIKIAITASTGIAAKIIGGVTIHSWAGIGLGEGNIDKIIDKVKSNPRKKRNWLRTDAIIIDEISMISWELWTLLDMIGKQIRKNEKPFGGIKVIAVGDFYQLPPVKGTMLIENDFLSYFDYIINLSGSYRSTDNILNDILQNVRIGNELTDEQHTILKSKVDKHKRIFPVLVSLRETADTMNMSKLNEIDSTEYKYDNTIYHINTMSSCAVKRNEILEKIALSECMLPPKLILKIGAPVICLINDMTNNLVNGSVGVIEKFNNNNPIVKFYGSGKNCIIEMTKHKYIKDFPDANISVVIEQYPLLLAYALTIHRAQGQTLSQGTLLLDDTVWEAGQGYTALSRFTSLDNISLLKYKKNVFKINEKVKDFYQKLHSNVTSI